MAIVLVTFFTKHFKNNHRPNCRMSSNRLKIKYKLSLKTFSSHDILFKSVVVSTMD